MYDLLHLLYSLEETALDSWQGWIGIGISLALISLLIWKRKHWNRHFPYPVYLVMVLGLVAVVDFFSGDLFILPVYLVVLALSHDRISAEKTVVSTLLFALVHTWMQVQFSPQEQPFLLVGNASLFAFFAWWSLYLQRSHRRSDDLKAENLKLLARVEEVETRLHEYIEELEEMTRRDYLTGMYNFSGFQDQVARNLARSSAAEQFYHVVCVDLVDFQQVNIKAGTDVGDQLLVDIARQLKKELPSYAQVARYDGDQFAVGMMGDDAALRLIVDTVERVIDGLRSERVPINCCLGTATYPLEAPSASELIQLAEQRLSIEQKRIRHREDERRRHLEKLSAVGQLAAGLAHEIRNPLTSIRGFIQISAAEAPEVKKWESVILPEIDRINDLLKQFLHLSESRPVRYTLLNLDRLIDDIFQLLNPEAILRGHELMPEPPESPVIVEADAEQLKQVLINLIQNGLESLPNNGVIRVRWKEMADRISIRVQDNGGGIPPEYMSRIFDPFFTTKGDGTGMGLSICHRIIDEHGGQIHVTSQPGCGTTFNLQLPLRQSSGRGSEESQAEEENPFSHLQLNRSEVVERVNMLKHF